MIYRLLFFVLLIASASCTVNFKPNDMEWLDVYNEGDTLIFKSELGELDTSYIISKDVSNTDHNLLGYDWRYSTGMGVVNYYNKLAI